MPTLISPLLCVALVAAVDAGGGSQGRSNQQPAAAIGQRRCPAAEQTGGGSAAAPHAQQQHPQTAPAGGDTATKVEPRAGALRPHIVLAIFDDLGYNDLGSFSGGALTPKTPFMDELMAGGIKLKQHYVTPICSPTRSSLMTGRYVIRTGGQHGVLGAQDETWIPEDESLLPERLSALGYRTVASGKWHLGSGHFKYGPTGRGFHEFFGTYAGAADHWEHISWFGGGKHRDAQRRSQHEGVDSNGNGGAYYLPRPKRDVVDHHHDRWTDDGTHVHELILADNMTHSTDAFTGAAVQMIMRHPEPELQPLFLFLPYTAPHWPTQFYQHHADMNSHIPSQKRREFAGMITQLDEAIRTVVEAMKRRNMWDNTLLVAFGDNGGEVVTGASNWPYRGNKGTVWEGGTLAAAFVHSPNPDLIPESRCGTESFTLAHVTDWYPSLVALAGGDANDGRPASKALDSHDVWHALVHNTPSPRTEMLYGMDTVVPDSVTPAPESEGILGAALRIGEWKLVEGMVGKDDWYGEDPSLCWPVDYIYGPEATDYDAIPLSPGGKVGDSGMAQIRRKEKGRETLKKRWLFNLKDDPTETTDLSGSEPAKLNELLARMKELKEEAVPPLSSIDILKTFFGGTKSNEGNGGGALRQRHPSAPKVAVTGVGDAHFVADYWDLPSVPDIDKPGGFLVDGRPATVADQPPSQAAAKQSKL